MRERKGVRKVEIEAERLNECKRNREKERKAKIEKERQIKNKDIDTKQ